MQPNWDKGNGLLPCIVQDHATGEALMLAYLSKDSLRLTRETGKMHYFSRSRQKIWMKGEESGHTQELVSLRLDCDGDTFLALVKQTGPACHTNAPTCFLNEDALEGTATGPVLTDLWRTLEDRRENPVEGSHTTRLLTDENLRLKKVAEEAAELILGCAKKDPDEVRYEAADLVYHALVACAAEGVTLGDVLGELAARRKKK